MCVLFSHLLRYNENGFWRIKTNQELDKIITHKNLINFARAQRLGWLGDIERMPETRTVKAIHSWKHISKRPTGRPKTRWEYDVKKRYTEVKSARMEEDGRNWLRRPKLFIKSVQP
jgi:hypothetical protein